MREGAKRRLIGAVILVLLAVIFVPMLVEEEALRQVPEPTAAIPEEPDFEREFTPTEVFLEPGEVPLATEPEFQSEADSEYAGDAAPDLLQLRTDSPIVEAPPVRSTPPPPVPVAREVVKPPVAPPTRTASLDGPGWIVQVASLSSASNAASHEKKLRGIGFQAFIEKADVAGKVWYRVRVGPEAERAAANALAGKLKERGYPEAFVKYFP